MAEVLLKAFRLNGYRFAGILAELPESLLFQKVIHRQISSIQPTHTGIGRLEFLHPKEWIYLCIVLETEHSIRRNNPKQCNFFKPIPSLLQTKINKPKTNPPGIKT
jgi:hypothetical protein